MSKKKDEKEKVKVGAEIPAPQTVAQPQIPEQPSKKLEKPPEVTGPFFCSSTERAK